MPRRKPRINIWGRPFGDFFELNETQMETIQAACGYEFSEDIWYEIWKVTKYFVACRPTVEGSAPLKDALKAIKELAEKANYLDRLIRPEPTDWKDMDITGIWLLHKDEIEKRQKPMETSDFFVFLLKLLNPLIALADFAEAHRTDNIFLYDIQGVDEDFFWDKWICHLWDIVEQHNFTASARTDSDKNVSGIPSQFVKFVSEFQNHLPVECRKSTQSDNALAKAIQRARGERKSEAEREATITEEKLRKLAEARNRLERFRAQEREDAIRWRKRDYKRLFKRNDTAGNSKREFLRREQEEELYVSSNEAADLVRDGHLEAAEKAAQRLLKLFPDEPDGYDRLGMIHQERGDNRMAADCYRKALERIKSERGDYDTNVKGILSKLVDELDGE
jgi:tetratricopeptide (TPR) repeat protein